MPFINDQLEANRRVIAEKESPPGLRQTRFTFDPDHLSWTLKARIVGQDEALRRLDRKSTRLNSSHVRISYAVFCLKKKKKKKKESIVEGEQVTVPQYV